MNALFRLLLFLRLANVCSNPMFGKWHAGRVKKCSMSGTPTLLANSDVATLSQESMYR